MTAAYTAGYETGKNEGYEKGYSAGWEAGREAAAELMKRLGEGMVGVEKKWENYAGANSINAAVETIVAALLKLKKP